MWKSMERFSVGGNATFIASEVTLPDDEAALFEQPNIQAPMPTRDMTNAPEHLYNLYITWDDEDLGTQVALFWTVQGDTLVAGAAEDDGNFVPNIYAKEYDTLNLSLSQQMGILRWQLQVKNITNPEIQEVYRSKYIGPDVPKSSYTKGIEYSLGFSLSF
jgi:outer membrane receptor protein involved in Fe transport